MIPALAFGLAFALAWLLWLPAVWTLRSSRGRRRFFELHHFHWGLACVALGLWLARPWLVWLGLSLMLDDGAIHFLQEALGWPSEVEGGPVSPWHWVFRHGLYNPACGVLAWACAALFSRGLK